MTLVAPVSLNVPEGFVSLSGDAPLTINFSVAPDGGTAPYGVTWDFGDGTNGTGTPVAHTYATAGTYPAKCTVIDAAGAKLEVETPVDVIGGVPAPSFTCTLFGKPASGPAPLLVEFSTTVQGGKSPFKYYLEFGDGNHAAYPTVNHKYTKPGSYTATQTVTDATGAKATDPFTVDVFP